MTDRMDRSVVDHMTEIGTGTNAGGGARDVGGGTGGVMARVGNARFPVRTKLVAVLLLPVTLLLAVGASQVASARQDAREARAEGQLAAAVTGPGSLLNLLVDERNHTGVYLLGAEDLIRSVGPGRYLETRKLVDDARAEFVEFIDGEDDRVKEIYAPALQAVEELDSLRADVDSSSGERNFQNVDAVQELFERFNQVTEPLFDANRRVSLLVTEPVLQRGAAIVDQSLRQTDTIASLTYRLVITALAGDADGVNTGEEYVSIASLLRDLRNGEQVIRLNGEGDYAPLVEQLFASEHIQVFPQLVETALDTGAPEVRELFANAGDEDAFGYDKLRAAAEDRIDQAADDINADAARTQRNFTLVGLAVLLALAIVTTLVARSITRPLRSLTRQAMAMADERLPNAVQGILDAPTTEAIEAPRLQPINIRTRDEVADVAKALTTVQDSAVGLAAEQAALRRNIADSFVHLGRRNQTLLGRQLDFITELEQDETDPSVLANLFRLDHLATRMRRNAESLLVLAGIKPPRVWRVPVMISDIARAALSEIENYQRVDILAFEPVALVGSAAADLAHLLAELIENAIAFSPPHQQVEVGGRYHPVGPDAGSFIVTITDTGIGMAPEEIARANQRLAGQESFAVAPSQYLGHYVAGMIARRHDITVRLESSGVRGTTATVRLPASLLANPEASTSALPPAPVALAPPPQGAYAAPLAPAAPAPAPAVAVGRGSARPTAGVAAASASAGQGNSAPPTDTYRVGDAEFGIDFGTLDRSEAATAADLARSAPAALAGTVPAVLTRRNTGGPVPLAPRGTVPGRPVHGQAITTGRGLPAPAIDANVIGDAQRARYVRDTLSKFSAGLEKGRDAAAAAREQDEPPAPAPAPAPAPQEAQAQDGPTTEPGPGPFPGPGPGPGPGLG
jgi:signal transduction histidine kinase